MELLLEFNSIDNGLKLERDLEFNDYLLESEIIRLENTKINGYFHDKTDDTITLSGILSGTMVIADAISLEELNYDFKIELEEILENNEKILDIMAVLWQNIVLEVPLRLTEVKDLTSYQGEDWKLVSEEELIKNNNPFNELERMMGEE